MWGTSIIGFGARHYRYASGHEGDTALIGFSPRADGTHPVPVARTSTSTPPTLGRLGKHKIGKGCLYVKRLADVDESVLVELLHGIRCGAREHDRLTVDSVEHGASVARRFAEQRRIARDERPAGQGGVGIRSSRNHRHRVPLRHQRDQEPRPRV